MTPKEFYEKHATNVCNVPRVGHPEDPSGWAGVRRASEARFIAADCPVMTLADAFDFAEKYALMERAERRCSMHGDKCLGPGEHHFLKYHDPESEFYIGNECVNCCYSEVLSRLPAAPDKEKA